MRSLRARLVLGSALVAIVPLALVMILFSWEIERLVRAQAADRLQAALGGLQARIAAEGEQTSRRLEILGTDPTLKRLYLLAPSGSRDLSDYLEQRRFLLGLDFLEVLDTTGVVISDGALSGALAANLGTRVEPHAPHGPMLEPIGTPPALALTAAAPIPYARDTAGVVRGGTMLDAAYLDRLKQASDVDLVLRDSLGVALASTVGGAAGVPLPSASIERVTLAGETYLGKSFGLAAGVPARASITGLVSTRSADRAVATLQASAALLGLIGLAMAIALGALWSSQVSRPVERLAAFSDRLARGEWDEPLALTSVRELETLVAALDRMRRDLLSYRERLVISGRQAAWSQMARKVAHEIKNPLTPIAVSIADLRRSYQLQRPEFPAILDQATRTVGEEVARLERLLREFSEYGRFPAPRIATCSVSSILGDLGVLYGAEIEAGRLVLSRPDPDIRFAADGAQIHQALVNLIKNGLEAAAAETRSSGGAPARPEPARVTVSARVDRDLLELSVADEGPGVDSEQRAHLFVPGFTTKSQGSGLGLTIVERIVSDHHGSIAVDSAPGSGTVFRIRLPLAAGAA